MPSARSATIEPILPQPITPSVLPEISTPRNLFFSHLPARVEASASGICRASDNMSVMACSAVVIELPNGVFITMTPRAVAAGISTLSTPMPARPITFRFCARSRILAVTLVAERIASPSKPLMVSASLSLSLPRLGWNSTSNPRSLKIATAAGESASEMRTLAVMSLSLRSLRQGVFGLGVCPVEPERERLDVGTLNGRTAPDAQARRRVAVGVDVVSDAFLVESRGNAFHESRLSVSSQARDRRVDDLQANRRIRTRRRIARQKVNPLRARNPIRDHPRIAVGAAAKGGDATNRLCPFEGIEIVLYAQHRRRVDGLADEDSFDQLATLGHAENFRQRPR